MLGPTHYKNIMWQKGQTRNMYYLGIILIRTKLWKKWLTMSFTLIPKGFHHLLPYMGFWHGRTVRLDSIYLFVPYDHYSPWYLEDGL